MKAMKGLSMNKMLGSIKRKPTVVGKIPLPSAVAVFPGTMD
jgi:hypothetical protein